MMYTRDGDKGTTSTFGCCQRVSKSSVVAEALGALDEANSFIGLCRSKADASSLLIASRNFSSVLLDAQDSLFVVQAEVAGTEGKTVKAEGVKALEEITDAIEKELPPIRNFVVPGATEYGALLDVARAVARRAERRVVAMGDSGDRRVSEQTLAYLNRLSSLLYALARLANHRAGVSEQPPSYK
ncbi:MAG: cob(I)yrinic acid a,c-diamide adenosyltransferase [Patescibacteria group bacterium]|nr:cob(I)yrinic acid a,c-diamide adenosyltransferase [Patescibacteria group bacterium]